MVQVVMRYSALLNAAGMGMRVFTERYHMDRVPVYRSTAALSIGARVGQVRSGPHSQVSSGSIRGGQVGICSAYEGARHRCS